MARDGKVTLNSKGMAALLKSAGVRDSLTGPAQAALGRMKGAAPVKSGDLQASLDVWDDTTDRAVKRVGSRLPYAGIVEADTGFMARSL